MPHFSDVLAAPQQEKMDTVKPSEATYANPDKLILPEGIRNERFDAHSSPEASPFDNLSETQAARLERLLDYQIPREERFEGPRGDSLCTPDLSKQTGEAAQQWLDAHGLHGIEYRNGFPDFSGVALESVTIPDMTTDKTRNFKQAYEATAKKWNEQGREGRTDWKPSDVKTWKTENGLAIHENEDLKTCEFVPIIPHSHFSHIGGRCIAALNGRIGETRIDDTSKNGGGFYDQFDA